MHSPAVGSVEGAVSHQRGTLVGYLRVGSIAIFQLLGLYWPSPESGDLWYGLRRLRKMI